MGENETLIPFGQYGLCCLRSFPEVRHSTAARRLAVRDDLASDERDERSADRSPSQRVAQTLDDSQNETCKFTNLQRHTPPGPHGHGRRYSAQVADYTNTFVFKEKSEATRPNERMLTRRLIHIESKSLCAGRRSRLDRRQRSGGGDAEDNILDPA